MKRLAPAIGTVLLLTMTGRAAAQEMKPFEVNMDRVKVAGEGRLGDSKTYLIPTLYLFLAGKGSVWAQKGGAQAHAKFFVDGLDRPWIQEMAKKLYDDLVAKIRAAGYTVMTYDDIKADAKIAAKDMMDLDKKFGLPTKDNDGLTYVVGAPTDEQTFSYGITGPVWPFRGMAKDKDMVVLVPQIWFTTPLVGGKTEEGFSKFSAGITISPVMLLHEAMIWGLNPKQAGASIVVQQHGQRHAAEVAGAIKQLSEDKTDFSDTWKRTSGDFSFTLNQPVVAAGVQRVGIALNDLIVATLKKAHK